MLTKTPGAIDLSGVDVSGLSRPALPAALFDAALAAAGDADFADPFAGCGRFVGFASDDGDGHWITIGAHGEAGDRHGGTPVFIRDGRIIKGAPSLTGKKIDALKEDASDLGSHRAQLKSSREYARAVWAKKARQEGHDPKHLHQLAAEMMAHDAATVEDRTKALQSARKVIQSYGGDWRTAAIQAGRGGDATKTKGIDVAAESMARQYPHLFQGGEGEHPTDRLFDMLAAGNPTPMREEDAYQQAIDELRRYGPTVNEKSYRGGKGGNRPKAKPGYEDDVPFAADPLAGCGRLVAPFTGPARPCRDGGVGHAPVAARRGPTRLPKRGRIGTLAVEAALIGLRTCERHRPASTLARARDMVCRQTARR